MFTIPAETAPQLLFFFFLTLVLVVTAIAASIYWQTIVDTFALKRYALKKSKA